MQLRGLIRMLFEFGFSTEQNMASKFVAGTKFIVDLLVFSDAMRKHCVQVRGLRRSAWSIRFPAARNVARSARVFNEQTHRTMSRPFQGTVVVKMAMS